MARILKVKGKKKVKGEKRSKSKSKSPNNSKNKKKNNKSKKKNNDMDIEDDDVINYNNVNDEKLREMFKNGELSKLKINDLKELCKGRNIKTKAKKKNDIIDAIEEYLENN